METKKHLQKWVLACACMCNIAALNAQIDSLKQVQDQEYIQEIETTNPKTETEKVLHAEPLFIDLIRDLGARKGEREWNVGFGLTDRMYSDEYTALVEYEWAPINRLGLEVELPFSIFPRNGNPINESKLQSVKVAAQYSFLVKPTWKTSMALGYIHELEMTSFSRYKNSDLFTGMVYNPFLVVAKRWGNNFHTLIYTGPRVEQHWETAHWHTAFQINSNIHYMIPGTRNFIGIEFNKEVTSTDFDMTIRPQMRVSVSENLLVGIVTGIPIQRENERFSTFLRLIYEPPHR